ncbi:MAG: single-stranded DNA-binding protein [Xylanivirga thermophila]|jgi:single-strand DNA-binding protein|uniref:single-stranded DNA-binding protein n=1 Tax=Xylanivirga thermophila TaxID=2496273 RepID=UPI00101B64D9|nr:single-stranded DNA-binding protein [Xylanivirga thermophila]
MLNKVVLIGRLTKDPEIKYLPSGVAVTTFMLAVNRNYTNQQGEREADFIPIVTWRGLAENCSKYLGKGRLVAVAGRIQTRTYDTPEGQRRYITEIVADEVQFLDRGNSSPSSFPGANNMDNQAFPSEDTTPGFQPLPGEDDELPF